MVSPIAQRWKVAWLRKLPSSVKPKGAFRSVTVDKFRSRALRKATCRNLPFTMCEKTTSRNLNFKIVSLILEFVGARVLRPATLYLVFSPVSSQEPSS